MFTNYLKIALRNLKKYKGYSFVNISGLAVGVACSVLILLWIQDEFSYDHFHEKAARIYRIASRGVFGSTKISQTFTPAPMPQAMKNEFPEIEHIVRLYGNVNTVVEYGTKVFDESQIMLADSTFFDVFSFTFMKGEPKTALTEPSAVVVTEAIAQKYFGDEDPLGKVISFYFDEKYEMKITGVIENVPRNSHFHFDFLVSLVSARGLYNSTDWNDNTFKTYLVLREGTSAEQLEAKFPEFIIKYVGGGNENFLADGDSWEYFLQPLTRIHLHSHLSREIEPNGNATYVYIFGVVAVFILLIACINFMNLTTARSTNRAKEVGMRKVIGSSRQQLMRQFLGESILISFLAFAVALVIVSIILPWFNHFVGKQLELTRFNNPQMIFSFVGLIVLIGLISGSYPAFVLSAFRPAAVISGELRKGMKNKWLRNLLVIFQFTISIVLIVGTFVIGSQLNFFQNKNLGFNKSQVIVVKNLLPPGNQGVSFKNSLLQHANITAVTMSHTLPGRSFVNEYFKPENRPGITLNVCMCDADFIETMQLEMAQGRFFSAEFTTDALAIVINETAAKLLNWEAPLGKTFRSMGQTFHVIGVVQDLHYESFHAAISPMAFLNLRSPLKWRQNHFSIRVASANMAEMVKFIENTWLSIAPGIPFNYSFLDQDYEGLYRNEQQTGKVFVIFSFLAIFIAALSLLGLTSFTVEQRTKEIGIRKVLGASVPQIILLLSKEFTKCVVIANVIAWPIAYYVMNKWLQKFAYRIEIGWGTFFIAGLLTLMIALITVSWQAFRAALANPVENLRYE